VSPGLKEKVPWCTFATMLRIYDDLQKDEYLRDKPYTHSMSFGMVAVGQDNEMGSSDILSIADERMYENKRMRKKARKNERENRV